MHLQIEPLQPSDMPLREKAFWKMTGPGAVLVGLSIGAGEIVVWPGIAAKYGASMCWGAVLGVFLQLWVNLEIGRWTIATGESTYTGFSRIWRGFAHTFIFFNVAGWILPAWARISGSALKALIVGPAHNSPDWLWTAITFWAVAFVLFGPKHIYSGVEKIVSALVALVVAGLICVALYVGTFAALGELAGGILNFGYIEPGYSIKALFSAIVFAGAGGTANLFYAYYLRDKHIGMGARIPELLNATRHRGEKVSQAGFIFKETPENVRRFRDWFKFVILDQTLYFWLLNTFTILLFIFGALAVLHVKGKVPSAGSLIWDESLMLSESMGEAGKYLFLIIGLATLFSTQITLTDGVARSLGDIFTTSFEWGRRATASQWYFRIALFVIFFGIGLTAVMEKLGITELGFLFNTGYIGGFAMAVYTPLLLWMNLRHLPKSARPGPLNVFMMSVCSLVYVGFALFCIGLELGLIKE